MNYFLNHSALLLVIPTDLYCLSELSITLLLADKLNHLKGAFSKEHDSRHIVSV